MKGLGIALGIILLLGLLSNGQALSMLISALGTAFGNIALAFSNIIAGFANALGGPLSKLLGLIFIGFLAMKFFGSKDKS